DTNRRNGNVRVNPHETVLVVGVNTVSELFLCSVREFAPQVHIAGVLAEDPAMRRRSIEQKPILGTIKELWDVLQSLEVHGISIQRIVVATAPDRLPPDVLKVLLELEKCSDMVVHFLSERLGLGDVCQAPLVSSERERTIVQGQMTFARAGEVRQNAPQTSFWISKRMADCFFATFLMIALPPLLGLFVFVVALDVGFPLIFWKKRPGLHGRPLKLYKFRTMGAQHDKRWSRIPDDQLSPPVGQILRRTRLDELPQLYNVLIGDMSFVGPRPLLPRDQS